MHRLPKGGGRYNACPFNNPDRDAYRNGQGGYGGIIIVDTEDRAEAERFIQNDPFTKAGLFAGIEVVRWRKAFFNKERLI